MVWRKLFNLQTDGTKLNLQDIFPIMLAAGVDGVLCKPIFRLATLAVPAWQHSYLQKFSQCCIDENRL